MALNGFESLVRPIQLKKVVTIASKKDVDVTKHVLVPKHSKLSDKEKESLLEHLKITTKDLPRISLSDPALADSDLQPDDIIKVERKSPTSNTTIFYRRVVK